MRAASPAGEARRRTGVPWTVAAAVACLGALAVGAACAAGGTSSAGADGDIEPASLAALGIPLGAIPGPGRCRIWRPRSPVTRQLEPGSCERLVRRVGDGGWLLRRPDPAKGSPDRVHLVVYGEDGPSLVRIFDSETGQMVPERPE